MYILTDFKIQKEEDSYAVMILKCEKVCIVPLKINQTEIVFNSSKKLRKLFFDWYKIEMQILQFWENELLLK